MKAIVAILLACTALSTAQAQTVYRCGNAYSQSPCPGAQTVEASDPRSPAQQAEGQRVADDERRLAAEMRRERLADERAVRGAAAASLSGPEPKTRVAVAPHPARHKKLAARKSPATTDFVAFDPGSRKRKRGA